MRTLSLFAFVIGIAMVSGCEIVSISLNKNTDSTNKMEEGESDVEESVTNIDNGTEEPSSSEVTVNENGNDSSAVSDEELNQSDNLGHVDRTDTNNIVLEVSEILQRSMEAMKDIKSMHINGEIIADSNINSDHRKETIHITAEMLLKDPTKYNQMMTVKANDEPPNTLHVYKTEDKYFLEDNESLTSFSNETTILEPKYIVVDDAVLMHHQQYTDLFYVEEKDQTYILTYQGSDEEYKQVVFDSGHKINNEFLKDFYHNMLITGNYRLTIDKQSFLVTNYFIEYHATTTGVAGEGEVKEKNSFTFTNFNQYEDITLPN